MVAEIIERGGAGRRFKHDEGLGLAGVDQHAMQIDAVDDDVRMREAATECCAGRDARDFCAVERIEHDECWRHARLAHHRRADAEPVEDVKHIRPELNAVTDRAEFLRRFEHAHAQSAPRQRQRCCKPAKAATDDEDGKVRCHPFRTKRSPDESAIREAGQVGPAHQFWVRGFAARPTGSTGNYFTSTSSSASRLGPSIMTARVSPSR